jgi:hypothetical protein
LRATQTGTICITKKPANIEIIEIKHGKQQLQTRIIGIGCVHRRFVLAQQDDVVAKLEFWTNPQPNRTSPTLITTSFLHQTLDPKVPVRTSKFNPHNLTFRNPYPPASPHRYSSYYTVMSLRRTGGEPQPKDEMPPAKGAGT